MTELESKRIEGLARALRYIKLYSGGDYAIGLANVALDASALAALQEEIRMTKLEELKAAVYDATVAYKAELQKGDYHD